ncbi:hypothetical protein RIF29_17846 [Crotalaria pallida]|uniref:Uncharacterized protein n=1 Tax=Crotalaria pallida TaxID=3830 RepID=A0AAN9IKJ5_CROPI
MKRVPRSSSINRVISSFGFAHYLLVSYVVKLFIHGQHLGLREGEIEGDGYVIQGNGGSGRRWMMKFGYESGSSSINRAISSSGFAHYLLVSYVVKLFIHGQHLGLREGEIEGDGYVIQGNGGSGRRWMMKFGYESG